MFFSDGYGNRRVVVFDHDTGAFKRMWGAFGNKPEDDGQCEASASAASALRKPEFTPPGPQQFSLVHSVRVSNDGMVYVADRENRRVQSFTVAGAFVKQLLKGDTPFARSIALSPDLATAHWNLALTLLLRGDFNGWEEYEWRFRIGDAARLMPPTDEPQWDGKPLPDGTLLLVADQGQ